MANFETHDGTLMQKTTAVRAWTPVDKLRYDTGSCFVQGALVTALINEIGDLSLRFSQVWLYF